MPFIERKTGVRITITDLMKSDRRGPAGNTP
jgi:hypothetical protein